MKIEIIVLIFLIVLNVSLAISQDSSNIEDVQINKLKERITTLENDIAVLDVSKEYFLGVMAITAGILAIISAIVVTANYIMSKRKILETIDTKILEQIYEIDEKKTQAILEIENKYDKIFDSFYIKHSLNVASINRTMSLITKDEPLLSLLWVMRALKKLNEAKTSGNEGIHLKDVAIGRCNPKVS